LAFITKLNVCLNLRCDCLRDGDTDGVTVDNMITLRKPLEKCLLGVCPLFPFDLADQHAAVAASMSMGAQSAGGGGAAAAEVEGGTLVRDCRGWSIVSRACGSVVVCAHAVSAAATARSIRRGRAISRHPNHQGRLQRSPRVQVPPSRSRCSLPSLNPSPKPFPPQT
jgi:hypothetical protein